MADNYTPATDMVLIIEATIDERDRMLAILMGAYVEDRLKRLLESDLPGLNSKLREKLFEGFGPLSTVAARMDVARARGLITPDLYSDTVLIARIRNRFAHNMHIHDFDHLEVKPLCEKLEGGTVRLSPAAFQPDKITKQVRADIAESTARGRFVSASWNTAIALQSLIATKA